MSVKESLLAPGPVNLHPEVRRILGLPMIHHRTPEFDHVLARVLQGLKTVFGTSQRVFIHTSTGSGGMESLLVNTLSPGDKVLVVVSGKFGERWAAMAKTFGLVVHTLDVPWGEAVDPLKISTHLKANPETRAVCTQACETSSGVLHPIKKIAAITAVHPETILLVDGITAVGALPLPMDEWGIDGLVAGSQKAFMLPTGLSFVSLSPKAWSFAEKSTMPKFYFDLRKERKSNESGETLFSTAVPLVRALDWVLTDIETHGLKSLYETIDRRARMTREFAKIAGFSLFAQSPSPSLTAINMPERVDGQKVRAQLESKFAITVMGGQDQAKGKILRIGHMGFITDDEMIHLFESIGKLMEGLQPDAWTTEKTSSVTSSMKKWIEANP